MANRDQPFRRRTVLRAVGISVLSGTTITGTASARRNGNGGRNDDLISVDPTELQLEADAAGEVDVKIQGPPFGRTDVKVTGAPAEPEEFRLEGRNASETVQIGPVDEDTTAEFHAVTRNGDEQVVPVVITVPDPLLAGTNADTIVEPIVELGDDHAKDQFDLLESLDLTDPFTLAVEAPALAGENSTDYAITAYYDEFGDAPNDRLSGPSVPLAFNEEGIASVTIGSAGTDADVTTWIAPGPLSEDATLVNQIEVPAGSERVAVETMNGDGLSATGEESNGDASDGEFTDHEEV